MSETTRVLVVDDHAIVRSGLSSILAGESAIKIVGEATDGKEAIAKAAALQPDVILLDILMPRCTGLEALPLIREKAPEAKVLMLTVSNEEKDLFTALKYGAQGYVLKGAGIAEVVNAIKRIAAGEVILSPQMAGSLVSEFRQRQNSKEEMDLSPRELEVLKLVGEGLTNAEIAEKLFLGESTVRTYLSRLLDKLHLRNRAAAVAYATRRGMTSA
ncbi:response regulator [Dehalogenimonas alkenigignens]|uniref:Response regulator containing a CheY-like receiver domain and an HTH DNA-binding domain n=1 Tax=Dehalogenimonas alkenigignens TaxID=1217799 RepID=A0A0W0GHD1_9CHLR|nr:response regulator transcription factor [Dehalogenimonas alkenigignens]KTB47967.1 Response regulator containing a CheY-like receiver domain and an HTH DNA-binding domain [Dehalogenimonas alkenigignens]